jgi:F-type H+-transporting ATPase subunit delta
MIPSAIFARYARALVDVVMERQEEPSVTEELKTYREIFQVPDLLSVLHSPAVPRETKGRLLDQVMARYPVSPTTSNFLRVLLQHNRIRYFEEIFDYYLKSVNNRKGIISAEVTTAQPLSEKELSALRGSLSAATGRIVVLNVRPDPELLGGLIVQIGSTVYDGSIRRQLAEMRQQLAGRT